MRHLLVCIAILSAACQVGPVRPSQAPALTPVRAAVPSPTPPATATPSPAPSSSPAVPGSPTVAVDRPSVAMTSTGVSQPFTVVFRGFPLGTEAIFSLVTDSAGVVSELGEFALSPLPQKVSLATDPFLFPLRLSGTGKPGRVIHYGRVSITFLVGGSPRQVAITLTQ